MSQPTENWIERLPREHRNKISIHNILRDVVGFRMKRAVLEDRQEGVQRLVGYLRDFAVVVSSQRGRVASAIASLTIAAAAAVNAQPRQMRWGRRHLFQH